MHDPSPTFRRVAPHALYVCAHRVGLVGLYVLLLSGCGATTPGPGMGTETSGLGAASSAPANVRQTDLALLQGTWQAEGGLGATKVIAGNRETVIYRRKNGAIIGRFMADIEVQRGLDDTVRLMAWRNLRAIEGKAPPETSGAYVYNTDGARLVEFRGAYGTLTERHFADAIVWRKIADSNGIPLPAGGAAQSGPAPQGPSAKAGGPAAHPPVADTLPSPAAHPTVADTPPTLTPAAPASSKPLTPEEKARRLGQEAPPAPGPAVSP